MRFVTQSGVEDTRPDVVALDNDREVIHIEGKFWAGLTEGQANNSYLKRLLKHHQALSPDHPCRGVLVWVCPPRRSSHVWADALARTEATELVSGEVWRFARTPQGQGVALIDWVDLCQLLEHSGSRELAEDARQLGGFVKEVDENAFLPWTVEQVTDQEWARRHVELITLTHDVREAGVREGVLEKPNRHSYSTLAYAAGPVIYPGGLWTALLVAPDLQAKHGLGPWYLRWWKDAAIAREALRGHDIVELSDGCAVPVPLRPGAMREEVIKETVEWLRSVGPRLAQVKADRAQGTEHTTDSEMTGGVEIDDSALDLG